MAHKRDLGLALAIASVLGATVAQAGLLGHGAKPAPASRYAPKVPESGLADIRAALDERRYVDAASMLDEATLAGAKDPRLIILSGELNLRRGRLTEALEEFKQVENLPAQRAEALEGEGLALSMLGRSDEALATLKRAVAEDPGSWRSFNALGGEYDARRSWADAEAAYATALAKSGGSALVLNNRGYSRLLQNRLDDAVADLVAALRVRPDFAEARTNLRLALAMKGDYRAALASGSAEEQPALLNNAGFIASMRGDYDRAEDLLGRAVRLRSVYYEKASENLKLLNNLKERRDAPH